MSELQITQHSEGYDHQPYVVVVIAVVTIQFIILTSFCQQPRCPIIEKGKSLILIQLSSIKQYYYMKNTLGGKES